jgi:hypothetical protein
MSNSHSCLEDADFKPPRCFHCNTITCLPDCKNCSNVIIRNSNNIQKCSACKNYAINIEAEIFSQKITASSPTSNTNDSYGNEEGSIKSVSEFFEAGNGTNEAEIKEDKTDVDIEVTKGNHNISITSRNDARSFVPNEEASFPSFNKDSNI